MHRWILALGAVVVAAVLVVVTLPGAIGTTFALWNTTATAGATVTAGTWAPSTPTPTPTPTPATPAGGIRPAPRTAITAHSWNLKNAVQFCTLLTVQNSGPRPAPWELLIDVNAAPFNGALPREVTGTTRTGPDASGILRITSKRAVPPRREMSVEVCVDSGTPAPIVAAGSSTYTYTTAMKPGSDANHACAQTTITGHAFFYTGFEVAFDWQQLLADAFGTGSATYEALIVRRPDSWHGGSGTWTHGNTETAYTGHGTDPYTTANIRSGQTIALFSCT